MHIAISGSGKHTLPFCSEGRSVLGKFKFCCVSACASEFRSFVETSLMRSTYDEELFHVAKVASFRRVRVSLSLT